MRSRRVGGLEGKNGRGGEREGAGEWWRREAGERRRRERSRE